jgi:isopenicillin N synthase-like dioxygenase
MACFADALGLPHDIFTESTVDPGVGDSQTTLRLLHYHDITGQTFPSNYWRGGYACLCQEVFFSSLVLTQGTEINRAHADFDCLTLLFQRSGQSGLEVCPGREVFDDFGTGNVWTPVGADPNAIVCNIGDQLMRWSDDRLKSTFHRVRTPQVGEYQGESELLDFHQHFLTSHS